MGKVTIIIESEEVSTSDLERMVHEMEFDTIVNADPDVGIYVVPSDEEAYIP